MLVSSQKSRNAGPSSIAVASPLARKAAGSAARRNGCRMPAKALKTSTTRRLQQRVFCNLRKGLEIVRECLGNAFRIVDTNPAALQNRAV
jgi:hypothetical protein